MQFIFAGSPGLWGPCPEVSRQMQQQSPGAPTHSLLAVQIRLLYLLPERWAFQAHPQSTLTPSVRQTREQGEQDLKASTFPCLHFLNKYPKSFLMSSCNISKCCGCCRGCDLIITGTEGDGQSGMVKSNQQAPALPASAASSEVSYSLVFWKPQLLKSLAYGKSGLSLEKKQQSPSLVLMAVVKD